MMGDSTTALLVLDIGNSAVKGGWYTGSTLSEVFVEPYTSPGAPWVQRMQHRLQGQTWTRAGLVSVVPERQRVLAQMLRASAGAGLYEVDPQQPRILDMAYDTPATLGADRFAAAVAGWVRHGQTASPPRPVLVIDAGTAVTYEAVSRAGVYLGGAIAPGPGLLRRSLHEGTAQLPEVPLDVPPHTVGRSTQEALQAGLMWGLIDSVEGMVRRMRQTLGPDTAVVATGGWASRLAGEVEGVHVHEPHLVLDGVRLLMDDGALTPPG
ncbi:MAG: type III pantothenate kinase [Bacteroidota bacterium]